MSRATDFLAGDYSVSTYWWEPLEMCRKLVLTGWVLMIGENYELARVVAALLASIAFLVARFAVKPLKRPEDGALMTVIELSLILTYTCVLLIKTCDFSADLCATYGFGSTSNGVYLFFIFGGISSLLVLVIIEAQAVVQLIAAERSVREMRVKGSGKPPELTLLEGQKFHLFLSHVWDTAQDAVAVIKRQLQLLLPEVQVFLDVDDLEDIGDLETYIEQSSAILMFLSKGYFRSRNCLREVTATLEQGRPYLFVHEADGGKGGGTLNDLMLELHNVTQREKLFDGRRTTQWHRIADFQLVSLIHIAEDMLRFSASHRGKAVQLYIPGSLQQQKLTFETPVVLYVSSNNPGAMQAAAEMQATFKQIGVTSTPPPNLMSDGRVRRRAVRRSSLQLARLESVLFRSSTRGTDRESKAGQGPSTQQGAAGADHAVRRGEAKETEGPSPTHFLLYLNKRTYMDDMGVTLAQEVRGARASGLQVAMMHENDEARGGCPFSTFFHSSPQDLIDSGLYRTLAIAFVTGEGHREVSRLLFAKSLGAQVLNAGKKRFSSSFLLRRTISLSGQVTLRWTGAVASAAGSERSFGSRTLPSTPKREDTTNSHPDRQLCV